MADKLPSATPADAEKQQKDSAWPRPGDEGYVHPDGTPQSVRQLEENRQAQADRDAAGSVAHGAPLGRPGPQADTITRAKVENAAKVRSSTEEHRSRVEKQLDDVAAEVAKSEK